MSVTGSNPFLIEFLGVYANTDVPQISLANNSAFQNANTINLNVTQHGQVDMFNTPTINSNFTDGTNDAPGTDEVQNVWLNGAITGSFDISWNGNTTTWNVGSTTINNVCDAIIGSGYYSISDFGDNWHVTFQGAYAAMDVPLFSISNNTTDGNPTITSITEGVYAVSGSPATQQITFSPPPESGTWALNFGFYNWDQSVSGSIGSYNADGGSAASGTVTLTYFTNGSGQSPLNVGNVDLQYLYSPGQQHIFVVELSASPDQGTWRLLENSSQVGSEFSYLATGSDVESQISAYGGGYTASGSSGGPWTITSTGHVAPNWAAAEGATFLRRNVAVDIRTNIQGAPDLPPEDDECGLLRSIDKVIRREVPGGQIVINRRINIMCVRYIRRFR